jgi:hypothetical protein
MSKLLPTRNGFVTCLTDRKLIACRHDASNIIRHEAAADRDDRDHKWLSETRRAQRLNELKRIRAKMKARAGLVASVIRFQLSGGSTPIS